MKTEGKRKLYNSLVRESKPICVINSLTTKTEHG